MTSKIDYPCYTCGEKMVIKGDAFNPDELLIECPVCGEAFLLPKSNLEKLHVSQK